MAHRVETLGNGIVPTDAGLRLVFQGGRVLLLLLAGYLLIVRPVVVPLAQQRSLLVQERAQLAHDRAVLGTMGALPAQLDSLGRELDRGSARLFTGSLPDAMTELTTHTAALARSSGVVLTTVKPLENRSAIGLTSLPLEVQGAGRLAASLGFLHALSSATRLITVRSLRIERRTSGGRTDPAHVTFSAIIVGYRRSGP